MLLDNHNSVNGLREYGRAKGATIQYVPVHGDDLAIDENRLHAALTARGPRRGLLHANARPPRRGLQHVRPYAHKVTSASATPWRGVAA